MGRAVMQLMLLVRKNFLLQVRRPIGAIIEILIPIICMAITVWISSSMTADNEDSVVMPHCFETTGPMDLGSLSKSGTQFIILSPATKGSAVDNMSDAMISKTGYLNDGKGGKWDKVYITNETMFNSTTAEYGTHSVLLLSDIALAQRVLFFEKSRRFMLFSAEFTNYTEGLFNYSIRAGTDSYYSPGMKYDTGRSYLSASEKSRGEVPRYLSTSNQFLEMQQLLDESIMLYWNIDDIPVMNIRQGPVPPYKEPPSGSIINAILATVICQMFSLAFIWIGASISKELVGDKCSRMKETMKMMGLSNWILWSSWVISRAIIMLVTVVIILCFVKIGQVFPKSDPLLIFILLYLYALSIMAFCFFMSTIFSKTTTAIAGTLIGSQLLFVPFYAVSTLYDEGGMSDGQLSASCLFSTTCLGLGVKLIVNWEGTGVGLLWSNLAVNPTAVSDDQHFNFGYILMMLIVDIVFYSLLTWYVEAVFPGEYGIAQKPWFMFTMKYWTGRSKRGDILMSGDEVEFGLDDMKYDESAHEKVAKSHTAGIVIKGLKKSFDTPNGKITAVDNFSLKMYQDQVTSLLGHNGAGKTTVMSILTGLYSPSGGTAWINTHSILSDMDRIRESLGICPQHNVLFETLTVMEHLEFFIRLKGLSGPGVAVEADKMIGMLQLTDARNTRGANLSGGMKRKLSVGIALAGGSKVVILDEPTAGMDPYARRATWDLILENKVGRTILLTTHYMDEADLLGDRVAIMASGRLVCSGSSMFLKNKYGVGYHLSMVKTPACEPDKIDGIIKSHVPSSSCSSNIGTELVYVMSNENTAEFIPLLKTLEEKGEGLGVQSFGLSLTTMEEVFINVGEMVHNEAEVDKVDAGSMQFKMYTEDELNSGMMLALQQFKAMVVKRFINSKRNKKALFTQIVLPMSFFLIALLVILLVPSAVKNMGNEVARDMSLKSYPGASGKGKVYFADFQGEQTFLKEKISDYFVKSLGYNPPSNRTDEALKIKTELNSTTSNDKCCQNPGLQLNYQCAERGVKVDDWSDCFNKTSWGYDNCVACFNCVNCFNEGCYTDIARDAMMFPDTRDVGDDTAYFVNEQLALASELEDFWATHQAAFALSEIPHTYELEYQGAAIGYKQGDQEARWTLKSTKNNTDAQYMLTGWYSKDGIHIAPGIQNAMTNLILAPHNKIIQTLNHPAPDLNRQPIDPAVFALSFGIVLALMTMIGFSMLSSSFCLFIVEEKKNKSKHLQEMSGVNGSLYWLGTFAWDMVNYILVIFIVMIIYAVFSLAEYCMYDSTNTFLYIDWEGAGNLLFLLILYGVSSITFTYLVSLIFIQPVTAYAITTVITVIAGITSFFVGFIFPKDGQWLLFLPQYNLGRSIFNLFNQNFYMGKYDACLEQKPKDICELIKVEAVGNGTYSMDDGQLGKYTLSMFLFGMVYLAIVVLQELYWKQIGLWLYRQLSTIMVTAQYKDLDNIGEDDDVATERRRIDVNLSDVVSQDAVVMHNTRKVYGREKVAVENLSIGIPYKECFGLLGVNGAGKTSTFSMLTGDVSMSGGEAFLCGYDIQNNLTQIQRRVGYCPQFDALIGVMTGRELLTMFADLRGIPSSQTTATVNEAIRNLNLSQHADKLCGTYSGGNKRKLSTAIALVGNPPVLFLDEPTAGMDPAARRFLWNVLCALTANGTSIILTTHSMEECEALCSRLVIMVNGAFRCLGSLQHLKNKYGQGYSITVTHAEDKGMECQEFIAKTFPGAQCKELHTGYMHFECKSAIKWSYVFHMLESNRERLGIEDYAVNQTSLEQVFLNFAKEQHVEPPATTGCCRKGRSSEIVVPVVVANSTARNSVSAAGAVRRASRAVSISREGYVRSDLNIEDS